MGGLLLLSGKRQEAKQYLQDAMLLYRKFRPKDTRDPELLTDADFDGLVRFWTK
jgi:hypothetical protein